MNLRKKTILLVAAIVLVTLVATVVASNVVVLSGFSKIEHNEVVTQLERARDALDSQVTSLDLFVVDYATWDDTYQFILDNNTAYIQANLVDQTFQHSDLNLIMYVNNSGDIVYSKTYNIINQDAQSPLQSLPDHIIQSQIWRLDNNKTYVRGLIDYASSMFLISSRAILTSQDKGPIRGAVIMARQVTPETISNLQDQTHLNIAIKQISSANSSTDLSDAKQNLITNNPIFIKPANATIINGYALILDVNSDPKAILEVSVPRDIYSQGLTTINTYLILAASWFFFLGAAIIFHLEKNVISRLMKLTSSVSKIGETGRIEERGILSEEKFVKTKDELSILSKSINSMLDKIQEVTGKLQKSQRLAAVGELSVMVAHDLRNPLQGIKIAADCLKSEKIVDPKKKEKLVNLIGNDVIYCEKIVSDLLGYTGNQKVIPVKTDVKTLLTASISHLQIPENIKINDLTQSEPKIYLDADKMTRVFDNLIKNAFDAMPHGGLLTIKSEFLDDIVRLEFTDTGKGIEKEQLAKLFTPLFTTKAKGMGFGLAICQRIIEAHNGKISVESTPGIGTKFAIEIPRNIN